MGEHGVATIEMAEDGRWVAECHDCPWTSGPVASEGEATKAWHTHAGPVVAASRVGVR